MSALVLGSLIVAPVIFGRLSQRKHAADQTRLECGQIPQRGAGPKCTSELQQKQLWAQWQPRGTEWDTQIRFERRGQRDIPYVHVTYSP